MLDSNLLQSPELMPHPPEGPTTPSHLSLLRVPMASCSVTYAIFSVSCICDNTANCLLGKQEEAHMNKDRTLEGWEVNTGQLLVQPGVFSHQTRHMLSGHYQPPHALHLLYRVLT